MRTKLWLAGLVVILGCGGGGSDGAGGAGGTGAAGALGGVGGGGGGAGGNTATAGMPPCLATVAGDCVGSGACTTQSVDPSNPSIMNSCYANGVKACVTMNSAASSMVSTAYKADGKTVCYKVAVTFSSAGGMSSISFQDAAGVEIAAGTSGTSGVINVLCKNDGQTYPYDWATVGNVAACTTGTCACP